MKKQEIIQQAYGFCWDILKDYINENGFVDCVKNKKISLIPYFEVSELEFNGNEIRPKSLKGIENNNGWIKLDAKVDLPKETGQYLTRRANGIIITEWFYNNNLSWYLWKDCYSITHYQPIIKPREPLY